MTKAPEYTVGDTRPALSGTCLADPGTGVDTPVSGVGATATVRVSRPASAGGPIVRAVTVDSDGRWSMPWQASDLASPGTYAVEVVLVWADTGRETFPGGIIVVNRTKTGV